MQTAWNGDRRLLIILFARPKFSTTCYLDYLQPITQKNILKFTKPVEKNVTAGQVANSP